MYKKVKVVCLNCQSEYHIGTTMNNDFTVPICGNCHPIYKGESQVIIDTSNRITKFKQKLEKATKVQEKYKDIKSKKLEREKLKVGVIQKNNENKITLKDLLNKAHK